MKPGRFRYLAPTSLGEAVEALASFGDDAKALAGGQSLGPLMNLRLANPGVLIDLGRVAELAEPLREEEDSLVIGAMTRQRIVETSQLVQRWNPLLSQTLPFVAHRTIRNRGTIGGSLAHADPAAELPAVAIASGATVTVQGPSGKRLIPAAQFFQGFFTTDLEPTELVVAVRFPKLGVYERTGWAEFAPRRGDFALVGVAVRIRLSIEGTIEHAELVYSGVSSVPWQDQSVSASLVGLAPSEEAFHAVAALAAASCGPAGDVMASPEYRRSLMEHLTVKALNSATAHAVVDR